MSQLTLQAVMSSLAVLTTNDGFELQNPAGKACYDKWGVRQKVDGIPEYFPKMLNVDSPVGGKPEKNDSVSVGIDNNGKIHTAGMASSADAATAKTRLSDDWRDAVIDAVRESRLFVELKPHDLADHFKVASGEVKIAGAVIRNALVSSNALKQPDTGNVITLNINIQRDTEDLSEVIAKAIKASLRPGGLIHTSTQKR